MKGDFAVLLDKPEGMRSSDAAVRVKEIVGAAKAGHTGTLDPGATGLLIILLDGAVKKVSLFERLDKEYEVGMLLHRKAGRKDLERVIRSFVGEIEQTPPRRSAVSRVPRRRRVYSIEILSFDGRKVKLKARCEAGTYIRKLCHDIGERLGTGANMVSLRRTAIGKIRVERAVTLDGLERNPGKGLVPLEKIANMTTDNETLPI